MRDFFSDEILLAFVKLRGIVEQDGAIKYFAV